ncbi:2-phosphosulfolactate phosphatase [Amnibacterium flavum]|uniref:Uncharacterized protein n=1 Tax=Amnibacterium flavum TaxID=2173173 RepID=A0A2V1HRC8_9MICO|nr:2-phosphosulfolactate phosphatase [Amnibacterium flavum]PVZ95163.1 hypothetical protein DDQ50_01120 [Amnibacterium flavum]
MSSSARGQSRYQIRFDWGRPGGQAIAAGADVVVLVDALREAGEPALELGFDGPVLEATNANAAATANWVLSQQGEKGDRFAVAVVAAGAPESDGSGVRFCVEDLLVAGGVIDALAEVGIDYASPEAAAAAAAFQGLRRAVSHILSASVSGQDLIAVHGSEVIDRARDHQNFAEVIHLT